MQLVPGQLYKRTDLHRELGGQRQGGISTPRAGDVTLLFTGDQGEQYGYHDGFQEDGTFHYTGEGQIGDMVMARGNSAIRVHNQQGRTLHLFEYVAKGLVRYVGEFRYLDHFTRLSPDRYKTPRQA